MATADITDLIDVRVVDVLRRGPEGDRPERYIVLLEEIGGRSYPNVWVGGVEGIAIALQLERAEVPRPLMHTLAANLFDAVGGRLREVRITRLAEETFYAVAVVDGPAGTVAIDARPSDAVNLALRTGAPIRMERALLSALEAAGSPGCLSRAEYLSIRDGGEWEGAAQIAAEVTAWLWQWPSVQPPAPAR